MRAVWSLWSKPANAGHERWKTRRAHLLSWVASFKTAEAHYPNTMLITDREGADLLVKQLGLPFGTVSTELDHLSSENPRIWALGKLVAYEMQKEPFVHLDSDVYLWRKLPSRLERVRVFAQNVERKAGFWPYSPDRIEQQIGRVPKAWCHFRKTGPGNWAACCGVLGGSDAKFIRAYARSALDWVKAVGSDKWARLEEDVEPCVHIEQYYLAGFAYAHGVELDYLFEPHEDPFDLEVARSKGFTHLIAAAKRNQEALSRLEARVKRDWPEFYQRIDAICPR